MPTCKKCSKQFPNRIEINGKVVNAQNRKYCIECSPYGSHNTKKIHIIQTTRMCPMCKRERNLSEFYVRRNKDGKSVYCVSCTSRKTIERQQNFKKMCIEYKGGSCSSCGYKTYVGALEFHHKNPNEKDFIMSRAKLTAFDDTIRKELDKCSLLCSNCHREEHARLKGLI